jgi:hypothetical protein
MRSTGSSFGRFDTKATFRLVASSALTIEGPKLCIKLRRLQRAISSERRTGRVFWSFTLSSGNRSKEDACGSISKR